MSHTPTIRRNVISRLLEEASRYATIAEDRRTRGFLAAALSYENRAQELVARAKEISQ